MEDWGIQELRRRVEVLELKVNQLDGEACDCAPGDCGCDISATALVDNEYCVDAEVPIGRVPVQWMQNFRIRLAKMVEMVDGCLHGYYKK